jgi:hypothetical protein
LQETNNNSQKEVNSNPPLPEKTLSSPAQIKVVKGPMDKFVVRSTSYESNTNVKKIETATSEPEGEEIIDNMAIDDEVETSTSEHPQNNLVPLDFLEHPMDVDTMAFPEKWSVDQVINWLNENGVSEATQTFLRNENIGGLQLKYVSQLIDGNSRIPEIDQLIIKKELAQVIRDDIRTTVTDDYFTILPENVQALAQGASLSERIHLLDDKYNKNSKFYCGPKTFFAASRIKVIEEIHNSIGTLGNSNRDNRLIAGTRGIGKTFLFKKIAVALGSYPSLIVVYVNYNQLRPPPSELILRACYKRSIHINTDGNGQMSISDIIQEIGRLGYYVAFFADEFQVLYERSDDTKFERIINELRDMTESTCMRLFITGSSQTLVTRVVDDNEPLKFNPSKLRTTRLLPLVKKEEFCDFLESIGKKLDDTQVIAEYMRSGGIIGEIVTHSSVKCDLPNPAEKVSAVLHLIYAINANTDHFNPFEQKKITSKLITDEIPSITQKDIDGWADAGYILEPEAKHYCFLFPEHFKSLEAQQGALSFTEIVAIHHPEGRKLAELWEEFFAEGFAEGNNGFRWDKKKSIFVLTKRDKFRGKLTENQVFLHEQKKKDWDLLTHHIFKVVPDLYGFDLVTFFNPKAGVQFLLFQIKMGNSNFAMRDLGDCENTIQLGKNLCNEIKGFLQAEKRSVKITMFYIITRPIDKSADDALTAAGYSKQPSNEYNINWPLRVKDYITTQGLPLPKPTVYFKEESL